MREVGIRFFEETSAPIETLVDAFFKVRTVLRHAFGTDETPQRGNHAPNWVAAYASFAIFDQLLELVGETNARKHLESHDLLFKGYKAGCLIYHGTPLKLNGMRVIGRKVYVEACTLRHVDQNRAAGGAALQECVSKT